MMGTKEFAVLRRSRVGAAGKSLAGWFRCECHRLRGERRLFREELQKDSTDAKLAAELRTAMAENQAEQSKLDQGWKNSSLRKKVSEGEGKDSKAVVEERVVSIAAPSTVRLLTEPGTETLQTKKIYGYAAVFNRNSENLGGFIERIAPGAFSDCLKTSDVRGLQNHNPDLLFARAANKTLRLYEDSQGLRFYADLLAGDALSESLVSRIARQDITGCSFSFVIERDKWELPQEEGGTDLRIILKVKELFDVGPVTWPAYQDTSVGILVEPQRDLKGGKSSSTYTQEDFFRDQDEVDAIVADQERVKQLERLEVRVRTARLESTERRIRQRKYGWSRK